ncbi:MAG: YHS domain-containing (seleno)protein [Cyanobacteria bacterium P01_H01_bin.119]
MAIKKINIQFLLVGLVATAVLSGCNSLSQQNPETTNLDSEITQPQAEESTAASYSINIDEEGRALRGYDPVAYFTDGKPVRGAQDFSFEWNEAEYRFANAENRDEFISDPEKYAPANGGFCTFGVVLAKKFDGDPEVWFINNDRLYVFLNQEVKEKFLLDEAGNLSKVAENWPLIQEKSPEELES